ncbi:MAG: CDP-alcohol phosphatidyltransferase family protein [Thermoplasmata archaeon]
MTRSGRYRIGADLATLANGLLGAAAIGYILLGNSLFALALLVAALGFDGLDGYLARRAGGSPSAVGRLLDSAADAVSFAVAPGVLLAVHRYATVAWAPYDTAALLVGILVSGLALARLVYFTFRGYRLPYFLGASTPQTTLALLLLVLFFQDPGYVGEIPAAVLGGALLLAPLMVLPVPYPKMRRGAPWRRLMGVTSAMLAVALLPIQFHPGRGSPFYLVAEVAAVVSAFGLAVYYLLGPRAARAAAGVVGPGGASNA